MGNITVGTSTPQSSAGPLPSPEDQLQDAMQMPGSGGERLAHVNDAFSKLSPDEARHLYDDLKSGKSEVARQFNTNFPKDRGPLLQTLQSKFAQTSNAASNTATQHSPAGVPAGKLPVNQQYAVQKKAEGSISGTVQQQQLNAKLAASGKTRTLELPPDAGNDKLGAINVSRQKYEDVTITQYPNGVRLKTWDTAMTPNQDIVSGAGGGGRIHKAGSSMETTIEPPPGGKVNVQKDGTLSVTDSKGKEVAVMDRDGNFRTHTPYGEYRQTPDGGIRFNTREKVNPGEMRKAGPISPADYEKYGISTDGKTLRFPNGVEYGPQTTIEASQNDPMNGTPITKNGVTVPSDVGRRVEERYGHTKIVEERGEASDRTTELYRGGSDGHYKIKTQGGSFEIKSDGQISFAPGQ